MPEGRGSRRANAGLYAGKTCTGALARAVGVTIGLSGMALPAHAVTSNWSNPAGGNYSQPTNWNSGAGPVPSDGDTAEFNLAGSYTVQIAALTVPISGATHVNIDAGDVTFVASGSPRTLNAGFFKVNSGTLTLGQSASTLTLDAGAFYVPGGSALIGYGNDVTVGDGGVGVGPTSPGGSGMLTVDGAGKTLNGVGNGQLAAGGGSGTIVYSNDASGTFEGGIFVGDGEIRVESGAQLSSSSDIAIGNDWHASAIGTLNISGAGSKFAETGSKAIVVGREAGGQGLLKVFDSGKLTLGMAGLTIYRTGTVDFTGGTIDNPGGPIVVDGGMIKRTSSEGTIEHAAGQGVTIQGGGRAEFVGGYAMESTIPFPSNAFWTVTGAGSTLQVTGGPLRLHGNLSVQSGATLLPDSLQVGTDSSEDPSYVTLDGAGTSLNTGSITLGATGSGWRTSGTLELSNGATANVTGSFSSIGGSDDTLKISDGATLTVAGDVNLVPATNAPIHATITGTGSTLRQIGSGFMTIGAVAPFSSTITVGASASIITGTGPITINNATVGWMSANGNVTVNGGTLYLRQVASGRTVLFNGGHLNIGTTTLSNVGVTLRQGGDISGQGLTLEQGSSLTVEGPSQGAASVSKLTRLNVGADGSNTRVTLTGDNAWLILDSGTPASVIGSASGTGAASLEISQSGLLTAFSPIVLNRTGTISIDGGILQAGTLNISGGKIDFASGDLRIGHLSIVDGGQIDLHTNSMVIDAGGPGTWDGNAYTGASGLVQSGCNGGQWNGTGIISNDIAGPSDRLHALGVAKVGDITGVADTQTTLFEGLNVSGSDTLVMFTYGGDANLDGKINIDDYGLIDSHVGQSGTAFGWHNGDFNYDGKINIDDYGIIDANIGAQGAPIPASATAPELGGLTQIVGVTSVPEPASLGLLGFVGAAPMLRRRSRANLRK